VYFSQQLLYPRYCLDHANSSAGMAHKLSLEQPGKEFKKLMLRKRVQFSKETKQALYLQISGIRSEIL